MEKFEKILGGSINKYFYFKFTVGGIRPPTVPSSTFNSPATTIKYLHLLLSLYINYSPTLNTITFNNTPISKLLSINWRRVE